MPVLVASYIFLLVPGVAQGYLRLEILEIESLEDVEDNIHHLEEFSLDLLRGAEEMGIVLRESADTGQAVELAALFIAVDCPEFGISQRQIPVAARVSLVDLAVVRAVHGLEQILLSFLGRMDGLEGILAIYLAQCPEVT